jgi:hypothetical protein
MRLSTIFVITCFSLSLATCAFNVAQADTLKWSWTPPTERTDGTTLTPEEIAGYAVMINNVEQPDLLTDGENVLTVVAPSGEQCGSLATQDTEGRRSVWTDPVCKFALATPGNPLNVTVEIVEP